MEVFSDSLRLRSTAFLLALVLLPVPQAVGQGRPVSLETVVAEALKGEQAALADLKAFRPVLEVYLQRVEPEASGAVTARHDTYLLGRFNWFRGPRLQSLDGKWDAPEMSLAGVAGEKLQFRAHGFAGTLAPDWEGLHPVRYAFTMVRQERLGDARCYVIDVAPKKGESGFTGRIWVEDRAYRIVRFNGINRRGERDAFGREVSFNVDGWRSNVLPGVWLPSYVYVEEVIGPGETGAKAGTIRAQIRLWGYDPRRSRSGGDPLQTLAAGRIVGTPGAVEQVLGTVVRNLLVANDRESEKPIAVRVLLTSPLESSTMDRTIVVSRGLVDVLPDEASLAFVLAHELAHILLGHEAPARPDGGKGRESSALEVALGALRAPHTEAEEAAANNQALEWLQRSPYSTGLGSAVAFLRSAAAHAKTLPNLVQPGLAARIGAGEQMRRLLDVTGVVSGAERGAPVALPPGARLALDPWSDRLSLIPNAGQATSRGPGLAPFVISPLIPHVMMADTPALDYRP